MRTLSSQTNGPALPAGSWLVEVMLNIVKVLFRFHSLTFSAWQSCVSSPVSLHQPKHNLMNELIRKVTNL